MESSIDMENTEFPAVKVQRLPVGVLQRKHGKMESTKQFQNQIYLFLEIFKHTTCKCKWLGGNKKIEWSKSVATLLTRVVFKGRRHGAMAPPFGRQHSIISIK